MWELLPTYALSLATRPTTCLGCWLLRDDRPHDAAVTRELNPVSHGSRSPDSARFTHASSAFRRFVTRRCDLWWFRPSPIAGR